MPLRSKAATPQTDSVAAVQDAVAPDRPRVVPQFSKLFALLLAVFVNAILLALCPVSAHAQGGVPLWTNLGLGIVFEENVTAVGIGGEAEVRMSSKLWRASKSGVVDGAPSLAPQGSFSSLQLAKQCFALRSSLSR